MKQLYLLRHATALPSHGMGDKERKLAPEGLVEAAALGVEMARKRYHPDYVLCSPAVRTRETFGQLSLEETPYEYPERLYNSSAYDLLDFAHGLDDKHDIALIIAHNPGIYEFAASLCGSGDKIMLDRLMGGFHPCTMAVIHCEVKSWEDIRFRENELKDFLESKRY